MKEDSPTKQEWQDLFAAMGKFKKIAPWKWMYNGDLFGVQNPESGEIGYCCVMGNGGEMLALAVYPGSEGLHGYLRISTGTLLNPDELLVLQKCLMASFDNRQQLSKHDVEVIKSLGLKFRGPKSWPTFTNYQPGYMPWRITSGEARFLTIALQQAIEVALRFKSNEDLLTTDDEELYFVRVAEKQENGLRWEDKWVKPEPFKKAMTLPAPLDEVRLQRVKNQYSVKNLVWELEYFLMPNPVAEGSRPFFPRLFLWADARSGMILSHNMVRPDDGLIQLYDDFFTAIERQGVLPRKLWVQREELFELLVQATETLGIKLELVADLPAIERAKDALAFSFFR